MVNTLDPLSYQSGASTSTLVVTQAILTTSQGDYSQSLGSKLLHWSTKTSQQGITYGVSPP